MKNRRTTSQSSSASATPTRASSRHSLALYQFPQRGDQHVDLAFVVEDRQRDAEAVEAVAARDFDAVLMDIGAARPGS